MRDMIVERYAVRETIERYFFGVDAKSLEDLRACFTQDAEFTFLHRHPESRETVAGRTIRGGPEIAGEIHSLCSAFSHSSHGISSLRVDIRGEAAQATTFALVNVITGASGMVRGISYRDRLVRGADGWLIAARAHMTDWQYDVAIVPPKLF